MLLKSTARSHYLLLLLFLFVPTFLMAHGVSPTDQAWLREGGLGAYILVGAKHMVTGYDHILFLVGVIFFLENFKDVVKFVTIFTIGHSITLIGATHLGIRVDEHLIDAIIALSVLYKGFENLGGFPKILNTKSPNLLAMVFGFGLIHGLGLSTRLQSFDIGTEQILAKIVCFNLGVELGQITALIPIIFIIRFWKGKKGYDTFHLVTNWGLVIIGIGLFILQMKGYLGGGH